MHAWLKWLFIFGIYGAITGCGMDPVVDLDRSAFAGEESPEILDLRFLGQSPRSREILIFEIDFHCAIGDLSAGFIDVFINGEESNAGGRALKPIFLQNEIAPDTSTGTIRFSIEVQFSEKDLESRRGAFEVGLQLKTATGLKSNRPTMRFLVEKL